MKIISYLSSKLSYIVNYLVEGKHILLILFFFLFILIVLTREKKNLTFLARELTEEIRGLSIILIIIGHYCLVVLGFTPIFGYIGVSTFLLLSGFGLAISYKNKGIGRFYLTKRILRIFLPYWPVALLWLVLDYKLLDISHSLTNIIAILSGVVFVTPINLVPDPNIWYITYLIFLYVVFKFTFNLNYTDTVKVIILLFLSVISLDIYKEKFGYLDFTINWWMDYSLCFPVGVIIGLNHERILSFIKSRKKQEIIYIFFSLSILSFLYSNENSIFLGIFLILFATGLSLLGYYSTFLVFIGNISYELYLVHGPLLRRYNIFLLYNHSVANLFIFFIVIIILAFILNRLVTNKLNLWLINKSKLD